MNALNRNWYRSEEHIGKVKAQTGVAKKQLNQGTLVRSIYLKKGRRKKMAAAKSIRKSGLCVQYRWSIKHDNNNQALVVSPKGDLKKTLIMNDDVHDDNEAILAGCTKVIVS